MNKADMNNIVLRYAAANAEKKEITAEVASLADTIKEYFAARQIDEFEAMGYVARVSMRKGKKLNLDKVAALLGGEIPADCYEDTTAAVLTIKADPKAKGHGGKVKDGGENGKPKTAVVAA